MTKTEYKNQHAKEHYDRIHVVVPKGMKKMIQNLASEKGMSVRAYIQDLVRQDQEGLFDTMQIADKNRKCISGIEGNMHDGYDILFTDGYKTHRKTKKDVRDAIIRHCKEMGV
jgi:hypothetical protein